MRNMDLFVLIPRMGSRASPVNINFKVLHPKLMPSYIENNNKCVMPNLQERIMKEEDSNMVVVVCLT